MARLKRGMLKNTSGKLGDIVIKQYAYGAVVSKAPDMSNVKLSKLQKAKNTNFKDAVKYAQAILADPKKKAGYALKIKRKKGTTVYHYAISEYLNKLKAGR